MKNASVVFYTFILYFYISLYCCRISIEKSKKSSQSKGNQGQANAPAKDSSSSSKQPTQENSTKGGRDDLVERIKRAKDHYQVLGIDRSASDDDVKKAYRKLALKLHPDKNKTPGAEEAFKNVSKAFTVLSDPNKRESYDRYENERWLLLV